MQFLDTLSRGAIARGAVSALLLYSLSCSVAVAQPNRSAVSLEPSLTAAAEAVAAAPLGRPLAVAPPNFRRFPDVKVGELADAQSLTLRFAQSVKLTGIHATPNFHVEQGSSCVEGNVYPANGSCTLLVRFAPKGAGHQLGRITIDHSGSATPFYVGLGGNSYAPVISFTPAVISTVPGTFPASKGLLNGAQNLSVDGGDTVYIADTGNNLIRMINASGTIQTISGTGLSAPLGVVADNFGDVYFDEPAAGKMFEIFNYGSQLQVSGTGTDSCTVAAPCKMPNETIYRPGQMSIDPSNQLFFAEQSLGAAVSQVLPYSPSLARIYDPFTYQETNPDAFAVDAYDNMYSFWNTTGVCAIVSQYYSDAVNSHSVYKKIAGGRACGFAGDGGQARNALTGTQIGQMAFDVEGNLYFTDTVNQRVRRIDAATGIINTIAGTGTAGYTGDGGAATLSDLSAPTGVGVDSQGQVYIISGTAATGAAQVIRKLGPNGALPFSNQAKGTASAARTITISNTGNSERVLTNYAFTGSNPGEFSIDPATTSCLLTAGSTLAAGQSCKVGVIFKPGAAGTRTANLVFNDNTVSNSDVVSLFGVGTLPAATVTIATPLAGASYKTGTAVPFKVTVTGSSTAPTGTVTFFVDGAAFGSPVAIASGAASVNLTGLTIKTHTLGATYNGDANWAVTGPVTRTTTVTAIAKAAASVQLTSAASQASACTSASFKAVVKDMSNGGHTPTGTVQLKEGTKVLATATLANGSASLGVTSLSPGTHTLIAVYSGDSLHAPASSSTVKQVVTTSGPCLHPIATPVHRIARAAL